MSEQRSRGSAPRTEVRGMACGDASRLYHVRFSPKRRTHALQGDIRSCLLQSLDRIAREHNILLIEGESLPDHIHLLLRLPGALSLPKAIRYLKGASARRIFQLMPELKSDLRAITSGNGATEPERWSRALFRQSASTYGSIVRAIRSRGLQSAESPSLR
jgi:putative transposase